MALQASILAGRGGRANRSDPSPGDLLGLMGDGPSIRAPAMSSALLIRRLALSLWQRRWFVGRSTT
jgi:hypothetical protein